MKRSHQIYLLFICVLGMLLASISNGYRGFFVPTYKLEFGIQNTHMGFIIGFGQLISMIFAYYAGKHCLKIGSKRIIALGFVFNAISILLVALAKTWILLLVGYCGMSSGMALLVLGLNTTMPLITLFSQAILMNFVHGLFGFGSTIAQRALGWYLTNEYDWRRLFLYTAVVFTVSAFAALFAPGEPTDEHKNHKTELIHKKLTFFIMSAMMFYVVSEFLMGSWIINYFQEGYGYTPVRAAFYSTVFYGTFTVGRLLGGFIMHYVNRVNGIIFCSMAAMILISTGQFIGGSFLIFLGISGLFFSIIYPTSITLINDIYEKNGAYFIGISSMVTALGCFLANLIFGYLNDVIGVKATFAIIPISLLLCMFSYLMVRFEYRKLINEKPREAVINYEL